MKLPIAFSERLNKMVLVSIAPRQRNLTHGFQPKGTVAQSPGIQQSGFFSPAYPVNDSDTAKQDSAPGGQGQAVSKPSGGLQSKAAEKQAKKGLRARAWRDDGLTCFRQLVILDTAGQIVIRCRRG